MLEDFDARIQGLRESLAKGGMEALPVVSAILGGQRLAVTRTPEGRWELRGKAAVGAFYGDREVRRSQVVPNVVSLGKTTIAHRHAPAEHEAHERPG